MPRDDDVLQPLLNDDLIALRPLQASDWPALYAVAADPLIWAVHPAHDRWREPGSAISSPRQSRAAGRYSLPTLPPGP